MWVMTTGGFVSAVQDDADPNIVKVRSRDRKSLEPMVEAISRFGSGEAPQIIVGEGTDYPYRVLISRTDYASWLLAEVDRLNYTNFKDALKSARGWDWADAAGKIWYTLMSMVTDREAYQDSFASFYAPLGSRRARRQRDLEEAFSVPMAASDDTEDRDLARQILGRVLQDVDPVGPATEEDWFLDKDNRTAQKRRTEERRRSRREKSRRYA